jgi:hypothetical protein
MLVLSAIDSLSMAAMFQMATSPFLNAQSHQVVNGICIMMLIM